MPMKLKLDASGNAVLQDEKPVYIMDNGQEQPFDAPQALATISRLNGEARGHREAKEAAEVKLTAFEGIEDPEAAKKALETVANLESGELTTAAKVKEIKDAAKHAAEQQVAAAATANANKLKEVETDRDKMRQELHDEKIGGAFSRSKFISDKIAIPTDLMQARFGKHFDVKDGKIVAKDGAGNQVYSAANPGEPADFEEALSILVDAYPQKDNILKGSGNRGDNARSQNGNGGGGGNGKTMQRAVFDKLSSADQHKTIMVDKVEIVS